tara:strand:- start:2461 stop:3021 length:561 start_codon:yes stop_codon:yes gene_type:complete
LSILRVAGLDPSLSNFGIAIADLDTDDDTITPLCLSLAETKPDKNAKNVRKSSQDYDRCKDIQHVLRLTLDNIDLIFVEMPIGSQSARAMASYGMCIGIISGLAFPIIQVSPNEVKIATVGSRTASKNDMIDWATNKYPHEDWKITSAGRFIAKNEHMADALATIEAGLLTAEYSQAKVFMGGEIG